MIRLLISFWFVSLGSGLLLLPSSLFAAGLSAWFKSEAAGLSAWFKSEKEDKNLVRVAVMNFVDEKGQKNYAYLAPSISEAVEKSLKKRFVYLKTPSGVNEQTLKSILKEKSQEQKSQNQKNQKQKSQNQRKSIGLNSPQTTSDTKSSELKKAVKTLAKRNNLDIVVFGGYYTYQKAGEDTIQIIIKPKLYLSFFGEFITLEEAANPVDSTIFNVTEAVANIIVDKVSALIGFQQALRLAVIAPEYTRTNQTEGVLKSQRVREQKEQAILDKETERLKEYLD